MKGGGVQAPACLFEVLSMIRLPMILGFSFLLAACAPPVRCFEDPAAGVILTLIEDGNAFTGNATVNFRINGAEERACKEQDDSYTCGLSQAGDYVIRVVIDGRQDATHEVTIANGECDVETQSLEIAVGEDCGDGSDKPSVEALIQDKTGTPFENAEVRFQVDRSGPFLQCEEGEPANGWICGRDTEGLFTLQAFDLGNLENSAQVDVEVERGSCDVITEEVIVQLEAAE